LWGNFAPTAKGCSTAHTVADILELCSTARNPWSMRVAAFQRFPIFDDPVRIGETVLRDLTWADLQGVDLAVFPESYLQGHSYDRTLIERRAASLAMRDLVDGFSAIKATAILGLFERRGDSIFNSAMVIESGRSAGIYAKA
jgi:predicted amidohydrolase